MTGRVCAEPPLNAAKAPFRVGGRVEANWYGQLSLRARRNSTRGTMRCLGYALTVVL